MKLSYLLFCIYLVGLSSPSYGQFSVTPFGGLAFNRITFTDQNLYDSPEWGDVRYSRHIIFGHQLWGCGFRVDRAIGKEKVATRLLKG